MTSAALFGQFVIANCSCVFVVVPDAIYEVSASSAATAASLEAPAPSDQPSGDETAETATACVAIGKTLFRLRVGEARHGHVGVLLNRQAIQIQIRAARAD